MERPSSDPLAWCLPLVCAACASLGCSSTPKHADYVGNPVDMNNCCTRASTVCPKGDDWIACRDDQWECYRLGLWFEDAIKVPRDLNRAHAIFESMCDRHEMSSCGKLCEKGESRRCVDLALLGIAGAGGRPFPPDYEERDRETFGKACQKGDDVACLMLGIDYVHGSQRVVRRSSNCFDDHARCFAMACNESDPIGCALLCHTGDSRACSQLGELALSGTGFKKPMVQIAMRLLDTRCIGAQDGFACMTLAEAWRAGRGGKADAAESRAYLDAACHSIPVACAVLGRAYRDGDEVERDPEKAVGFWKRGCDAGDHQSCIDWAVFLLQAPDGAKDKARALELLRGPCADDEHSVACRVIMADGKVCASGAARKAEDTNGGCVRVHPDSTLDFVPPPYGFQSTEGRAGAIPRPPPAPQRHVGEGLWSGWKTVGNVEGGSFGVTPVVTRTVGGAHRTTNASGLVGFFSEIYMQSWYPAHDKYLRFNVAGAIGGGSAGVDGQLSHDAMGGYRFPFSMERSNPFRGGALYQSMSPQDQGALDQSIFTKSPHALFVRGGYSLRYSAVGPVLSSAIELPRVEAGYHYSGGGDELRALELRANAALVLVGRFNVDDDEHPLGGAVAWGGSMIMHARRAHVQLGAQRIQAALTGGRSPVHRVDTGACLRVVARDSRHFKYLVCLQEVLEHGALGGADVTAWQSGIFFGADGLD
ncbi:MAG: sel1 repeat family protein [Deltaproteobacteria bacterium]|nr:sel1 repeat family protein [Deltaproteobacteria bacterium]